MGNLFSGGRARRNTINNPAFQPHRNLPASFDGALMPVKLPPLTEYTEANLETLDVLTMGCATYVFVHRLHPAMVLLRLNAHYLCLHFSDFTLIDGNWYRVERDALHDLCALVETPCVRLAGYEAAI